MFLHANVSSVVSMRPQLPDIRSLIYITHGCVLNAMR